MRIIAGKHKSRKLLALEGMNTRPMMDKMKETIFNIIGPYFADELVLDLFGGSGALSLEALSRGAKQAYIVEANREAMRVIKENIASLHEEASTTLYQIDYQIALNILVKENRTFDIIFLDPPYRMNVIKEIIDFIILNHMLADEGIIVCQYVRNNYLPIETDSLEIRKNFNYASSEVCIYQKKE
ncbi:MAG: 16S rRNA (guanine(966)-N(2))-methyltransferase RsmD [Bacilli bacterium]|jgi:16S rRNA (guanine(966)-N(2))-methyltransferase RsmD|nr:16S rRNA (guanine(966)-N(2))-methyltransferase RsmD [Bacilli bacterium]